MLPVPTSLRPEGREAGGEGPGGSPRGRLRAGRRPGAGQAGCQGWRWGASGVPGRRGAWWQFTRRVLQSSGVPGEEPAVASLLGPSPAQLSSVLSHRPRAREETHGNAIEGTSARLRQSHEGLPASAGLSGGLSPFLSVTIIATAGRQGVLRGTPEPRLGLDPRWRRRRAVGTEGAPGLAGETRPGPGGHRARPGAHAQRLARWRAEEESPGLGVLIRVAGSPGGPRGSMRRSAPR